MSGRNRVEALFEDARRLGMPMCPRLVEALADADPLVRHVAAIELAGVAPRELTETAIRELLETLARLEYFELLVLEKEYAAVTAAEDFRDLGGEIVNTFAQLSYGQADYVIPRLIEFWSFDPSMYDLGHALIALAFPTNAHLVSVDTLSGVQRRVLQVAIRQDDIWRGEPFAIIERRSDGPRFTVAEWMHDARSDASEGDRGPEGFAGR